MTAPEISTAAVHAKARRRKRLAALVLVALVGLIAWGGYDALIASHEESTDNAYVQGNIVQITPQVGGTVMAIFADDNDFVRAGAPLVKLDPADTGVALHQAEAALAQTVRQVRQLYANNATLAAQVKLRETDVANADALQAQARANLERAEQDVQRRLQLGASGAVSGEELKHAQSAVDTARTQLAAARAGQAAAKAGVAAAREQLASNQALTQGVQVAGHPSVQAAAAQLRQAWLAAHRTELPAPVDGYIARRSVQLGQRVAAGTPLMAVVPLHGVWVDANFKETQLRNLRLGQRATLTADLYGSQVRYTGTVAGLGVGTGAAFALLPPQNATGNWIKVVQRIPVRIALDPEPLAQHPLRLGLSMLVTVDTREHGGATLTTAARTEPLAETSVYALQDGDADAEIARIIAANVGTP
ncbi:efflux RND transporter periplasmic adaptor subunit [Comamonas flocculans]|uniref:HlyD family efflux transporter periplasmic adaptor subunit n=1 Tax=Comamonas flocculans TaxID=2597701 RepID=A0A5B8RU71_9BURK|nr:efflux RND transporter periplasmic adaptor subunit [Comamonas flocculans]QEA13096.1 HlyD family efflux transporter periplasmic adaptor subunit [Comamonas flocculans]